MVVIPERVAEDETMISLELVAEVFEEMLGLIVGTDEDTPTKIVVLAVIA